MNYTTVIGVDESHVNQLNLVWPTWLKFKPSLLNHPLIVFFDRESNLTHQSVRRLVAEHDDVRVFFWPSLKGGKYEGDPNSKWTNPQRAKMLSGFVHVPATFVQTEYWLKLDLDVVATGMDDWIDEKWFEDEPAMVAHPWGYTKPADQMLYLDDWTGCYLDKFPWWIWLYPPLGLYPEPGSDLVKHKRIISWCGFFHTEFTRRVSEICQAICGPGQLPVPSQDGTLWYFAARGGFPIRRENMKKRGFRHCHGERSIRDSVNEVMYEVSR